MPSGEKSAPWNKRTDPSPALATASISAFRCIAYALRFLEAFDAVDDVALSKIDHIHGAVAEFSHEQALAREIDCHMVDAPGHALQCDRALQRQRRAPPHGRWRTTHEQSSQREDEARLSRTMFCATLSCERY